VVVAGRIDYVAEVVKVAEGFGYVAEVVEGGEGFGCMIEMVVEDWCRVNATFGREEVLASALAGKGCR
jgi:hypothetical protein